MKYISKFYCVVLFTMLLIGCDIAEPSNVDRRNFQPRGIGKLTGDEEAFLDSILRDYESIRDLLILGEFDFYGKHDITFNSLTSLTYDLITEPCPNVGFIREKALAVQLSRPALLELCKKFLYVQFIPCIEGTGAGATFYIIYRGVNDPTKEFEEPDLYHISGNPYARTFNLPLDIKFLRTTIKTASYGPLYSSVLKIPGSNFKDIVTTTAATACPVPGTTLQINKKNACVMLATELDKLLNTTIQNDTGKGRGTILFFGYDDSSPTNRLRMCLGNLYLDNSSSAHLAYDLDPSNYFLERTWP